MPNRFSDVTNFRELLGQLAGAASVCWDYPEKAGIFHSDKAKNFVDEAYERFEELLMETNQTEVEISVEFTKFVRKPFTVEAVEVTVENIHELSSLIGEFGEDEHGPYIQADRKKVPTVYKVVPGYWVTRMGNQIRCYSNRVFLEQFVESFPAVEDMVKVINGLSNEPVNG